MILRKIFSYNIIAVFTFSLMFSGFTTVEAASSEDFNAGNIISDSLFYKNDAMTSTQIQNFLNSKVPNCDTNGTKSYGGTTRAAYGTSKGYPPPYTCLKSYSQATPSLASNSQCGNYTGGTKSAAKIIDDVAKACGISEKVILVTLQKEQILVTDDWPFSNQYQKAMGYGCPDTSACDSTYYGFFNQVYNAARQFKRYKQNPENYNHIPNRLNNVRYNPISSCGSKSVTIVNYSAAGLYNYTPYTPNNAALSNLYGSGDSCSSYGNRNFWRYYTDWFGSTHPKCTSSERVGDDVYRLFNIRNGDHFYTGMACEANWMDSYTNYRIEGISFTLPPSSANGRTGIYRLKKNGSSTRLWTQSTSERDFLVKTKTWTLEGTAFIGLSSSSTESKKAVYRLYNTKTGQHLWTSSQNEINIVKAKKDWKLEGIAYYVYAAP